MDVNRMEYAARRVHIIDCVCVHMHAIRCVCAFVCTCICV